MRKNNLATIYLVAPTTPEERIELIVKRGTGFIYYVSREGVTGMQTSIAKNIGDMTGKIRKYTELPVAVGFGSAIRNRQRPSLGHVRRLSWAAQLSMGPRSTERVLTLSRKWHNSQSN